jgi:hypothetical protein
MIILVSILLIVAGIIALLLFLALFIKKAHYVQRDIIINAPRQKVFDYIKLVGNQENFNKHAMTDPGRIGTHTGTDGTVGYKYSWSGNKSAGEGSKEIMQLVEGRSIETEICFVKPMRAVGRMIMETESISNDQTRVYWSNAGVLPYPLNLLVPMVEKNVGKDMLTSLSTLKNILEK